MKILVVALALAAASTPALRDSDYLARLASAERDLAAAESAGGAQDFEARRASRWTALQNLAFTRAQVGDYAGALEAYRSGQSLFPGGDAPSGTATAANNEYTQSMLARFTPEPAIDAIVRAARDRQIVILNEAHHVPRHRAFALLLALELRKLGFAYLAMETFAPNVGPLARRGYPTVADGFYSDEPLFGDFIRQALRAGYQPVAYEQDWIDATESSDMVDRIDSREEAQANNLIERVLKGKPNARLFVYVGYSHAYKGFQEMPGNRRTSWMAERLRAKSGIDPLCIDQTSVIEPPAGSRDRILLDAIFDTRADDAVVLVDKSTPSQFSSPDPGRIDVQVFHRPAQQVIGREHWLAMDGYRKPTEIPRKLLPKSGRRLVQAFVEGESAEAVPLDQVLVVAGQPLPVLMLPKGKYRFAYQD